MKIISEKQFSVLVECPQCKSDMKIIGREHSDGTKWLQGRCDRRGHLYRNFAVDFIQPTNPFYRLLYKFDDNEYNENKKKKDREEELRKAKLEEKYHYQFRGNSDFSVVRADTKRAIEKEVLKGG